MRGNLIKIFSTHSNLRTDSVLGDFSVDPAVGVGFEMVSESLSGEGFRYIHTSDINNVWPTTVGDQKIVVFQTENSLYSLLYAKD